MNVEVITVPADKAEKDVDEKFKHYVLDRSNVIAKRFGMDPIDVKLKFFMSKGAISASLGPNLDAMGVYAGYLDCSDEIMVIHPAAAEGLLNDVDKEIMILIDYGLVKMYLCKKYYPEPSDFKLYYKYVSESLARFSAGNFKEGSIKFDIKMHVDGKKYRKDQELDIVLYIMLKNSGLDFIYENLPKIMEDMDIKKTAFTIYRKSLTELIKPVQDEVVEEERKTRELERAKRAAARANAHNASN